MAVIYRVTTTASPLVRYVSRPTKNDKKSRIVQCSKNVLHVNKRSKKPFNRSNDIDGFDDIRNNFIGARLLTFSLRVHEVSQAKDAFKEFQLKVRGLNRRAIYELSNKLAAETKESPDAILPDHCSDSSVSLSTTALSP